MANRRTYFRHDWLLLRERVVDASSATNDFCDQIGNALGYADENGAVAASYEYDAFGNILDSSGPLAAFFRHRFYTKLFDPDTGLCYYGHRWYSPLFGRCLSRDPIEEDGGEPLYPHRNCWRGLCRVNSCDLVSPSRESRGCGRCADARRFRPACLLRECRRLRGTGCGRRPRGRSSSRE